VVAGVGQSPTQPIVVPEGQLYPQLDTLAGAHQSASVALVQESDHSRRRSGVAEDAS